MVGPEAMLVDGCFGISQYSTRISEAFRPQWALGVCLYMLAATRRGEVGLSQPF